MGGIGMEMAKRAKGFDMHVTAVDAYRTDINPITSMNLVGMDQLSNVMSQVDVVMIACPLTEETRGLINKDNLSVMQPTAFFINVAPRVRLSMSRI